jgi:hypothetical protein
VPGQRGMGAPARIWRRTGLAGVIVGAVMGVAASAALADRGAQPDPTELWQSYPLEQKPATVADGPAAAASKKRNAHKPASSDADQGSGGPAPGLIVAIGFATALLVSAAIALRRGRRRPTAPSPARAAPVAAPVAGPPAQRAIEPPRRAEPPPKPPPRAKPPPAAAATRNGRAVARRKSLVCQVRWDRRARSFYAVSADTNGIENMVATSPHLDWDRSAPPEETPEARAALRKLAKVLREQGWRPLRAKGIDFDERRWYARRFRWPTEEELADAGHADAGEVDEQVSGPSGGGR